MLKVEAGEQHFERHAVTDVRELGAVEVEPHGIAPTLAWHVDPDELRLRVDEALDQPGAGQAIDPRILAGRPGPLLVTALVDQPQPLLGGARLAAGIGVAQAALELRDRLRCLELGLAGIEVDFRELVEGALEPLHPGLRFAGPEPGEGFAELAYLVLELAILGATVEQLAHRIAL